MARFRDGKGNSYECDRQTKTLKLVSVENVERFKNKEHDAFTFTDGEDTYVYYASLNADMTEYDTVFARGLSLCEGKNILFIIHGFCLWKKASDVYETSSMECLH